MASASSTGDDCSCIFARLCVTDKVYLQNCVTGCFGFGRPLLWTLSRGHGKFTPAPRGDWLFAEVGKDSVESSWTEIDPRGTLEGGAAEDQKTLPTMRPSRRASADVSAPITPVCQRRLRGDVDAASGTGTAEPPLPETRTVWFHPLDKSVRRGSLLERLAIGGPNWVMIMSLVHWPH